MPFQDVNVHAFMPSFLTEEDLRLDDSELEEAMATSIEKESTTTARRDWTLTLPPSTADAGHYEPNTEINQPMIVDSIVVPETDGSHTGAAIVEETMPFTVAMSSLAEPPHHQATQDPFETSCAIYQADIAQRFLSGEVDGMDDLIQRFLSGEVDAMDFVPDSWDVGLPLNPGEEGHPHDDDPLELVSTAASETMTVDDMTRDQQSANPENKHQEHPKVDIHPQGSHKQADEEDTNKACQDAVNTKHQGDKKRKREGTAKLPEDRGYFDRPTNKDVIAGRGGKSNKHVGNMEFLKYARYLQPEYGQLVKEAKWRLTEQLIDSVHAWGGRFMEFDETGRWYEIEHKAAYTKASQALRETPEKVHAKRARLKAKKAKTEQEA